MTYGVGERPIALAFVGDVLLTRRASVFHEPKYIDLINLLRNSDAAFANLETTIRRWDEGHPAAGGLGTYMTTPPPLLEDIKWMGLNLLSCANNHASDFGEGGVSANLRHLESAGIVHAGTGENLAEARAPAYLDTAAGRIGLIAATATFRVGTQAGSQRSDMKGRPGVNPLRVDRFHTIDHRGLDELKRLAQHLGYERETKRSTQYYGQKDRLKEVEDEFPFLNERFKLGDEFAISTKPDAADLDALIVSVREARRQADWVIVSLHYHEMGGKKRLSAVIREELDEPADFVPKFAHAMIDAGADVVAGHGPHYPLGIEIYRGKPIFYSLGNFFFQTETVERLPEESYARLGLSGAATPADFVDNRTDSGTKGHFGHSIYWESIAAALKLDKSGLREVTLHPLDLGRDAERSQRGRPILATGEMANRIIEKMKQMSARYKTDIEAGPESGRIALA